MLPKDRARRTMFVAEAFGAAAATGAGASDAGGAAAGSSAAGAGSAAPADSPSAATTSMSATLPTLKSWCGGESTGWRLLRLPKLRARRTVAAISSQLQSSSDGPRGALWTPTLMRSTWAGTNLSLLLRVFIKDKLESHTCAIHFTSSRRTPACA